MPLDRGTNNISARKMIYFVSNTNSNQQKLTLTVINYFSGISNNVFKPIQINQFFHHCYSEL